MELALIKKTESLEPRDKPPSTDMTMPDKPDSSFLRLPGEVRNRIYEDFFAQFGNDTVPLLRREHIFRAAHGSGELKKSSQRIELALLLTSRQVSREAGSIFWTSVAVDFNALELVRPSRSDNMSRARATRRYHAAHPIEPHPVDYSVFPQTVKYGSHFRTEEVALYKTLGPRLQHITRLSLSNYDTLAMLRGERNRESLGPTTSVGIDVLGKLIGLTHITIDVTDWSEMCKRGLNKWRPKLPHPRITYSESDFKDLLLCYPKLQSIIVNGPSSFQTLQWTSASGVWKKLSSGKEIKVWPAVQSRFEEYAVDSTSA